jgi:hypothetical protein
MTTILLHESRAYTSHVMFCIEHGGSRGVLNQSEWKRSWKMAGLDPEFERNHSCVM